MATNQTIVVTDIEELGVRMPLTRQSIRKALCVDNDNAVLDLFFVVVAFRPEFLLFAWASPDDSDEVSKEAFYLAMDDHDPKAMRKLGAEPDPSNMNDYKSVVHRYARVGQAFAAALEVNRLYRHEHYSGSTQQVRSDNPIPHRTYHADYRRRRDRLWRLVYYLTKRMRVETREGGWLAKDSVPHPLRAAVDSFEKDVQQVDRSASSDSSHVSHGSNTVTWFGQLTYLLSEHTTRDSRRAFGS